MSHSTIKLLPVVIICSLLAFCLIVGCVVFICRSQIRRRREGSSIDDEEKSIRRFTVERGRVVHRSQATPETKVGHHGDDRSDHYWSLPQEKSRNSRLSWDLKYWPVSKYFMGSKSSSEESTRRPSRTEKTVDTAVPTLSNQKASGERIRPPNAAMGTNPRKNLSSDTTVGSHPRTALDRSIIKSLQKAYQEDPVIRPNGPFSSIAVDRSGRRPSAPEFTTPKKKPSQKHQASETNNSHTPTTPTRRSLERRPATAPSGTKGFHTTAEPQLPPIPPSLASSFSSFITPANLRPNTPQDAILSIRPPQTTAAHRSKSQRPRSHRTIPRSHPTALPKLDTNMSRLSGTPRSHPTTILPKLDTNMSRLSGMSFLDPATPPVDAMSTITHYSIDSGTNYDGEVARSATIVPGSTVKTTSIRPTTPTKRSRLEGYDWGDRVPGLPGMVARVGNGSVRRGAI